MNVGLCLSYSDLTNPWSEGCLKLMKPLARRIGSISDGRTVVAKSSCCNANKNMEICCHLMQPGHLEEGFFMGKKKLEARRDLGFVRTLLIDNYDSYTYNIYQELSVVNGVPPVVVKNDEWTWEDMYRCLYKEKAFDNIVISPGPGSPMCAEDIGICLQLLLECRDIPILGVCLGHQALGFVHGARIIHALEPIHGRLSEVEHNGCRLFHNVPSGEGSGFKVVRYHSLMVDAESLPKELIPIAWTSANTFSFLDMQSFDHKPHAHESGNGADISFGTSYTNSKNVTCQSLRWSKEMDRSKVLMGIMHSTRPHYGLQFHPESIATCHGRQIFENFREMTKDYWLRSNATSINHRNFHYAACLQVPSASQLFEVHGTMPLVHGEDGQLFKVDNRRKQQLGSIDEKIRFSISTLLDFSESIPDKKHLKLRWKKIDQLAAEVGGAKNIFCHMFGSSKADNTFWLDSSSTEKRRARFSYMGGKGGPLWKRMTFRLSDESNSGAKHGGHLTTEDAQGSIQELFLENGFLHFLNQELLSFGYDERDFERLPFEFYGGYIGYIGYGLKVECGMLSNSHKSRTPDACFFFADNFIVIDHKYDDVYIMSIYDKNTAATPWLDEIEMKLLSLKASATRKKEVKTSKPPSCSSSVDFLAEKSREQYVKDVKKCLEYIKDGESYELCFTTQLRKTVDEIDPLRLYLHLREKNPAPYAAWLNFSSENLTICCSSPERFLCLDRNGALEAKPIKGTIARGTTQDEDEKLRLQLLYSEKDQAENLMIVDLLRNDLGRVCEPGSVHVPRLMDVESYATVHTMVSTIRGKKKLNVSAVDCVRAAFPGGSMTGAPKLRSMEILDSLESCSRGIYSGSIGFFSYNQTFDLNIVIRTIVIHEGEASIGAGGAIVALSNPEDEYNEMLLKARAPTKAVAEIQYDD